MKYPLPMIKITISIVSWHGMQKVIHLQHHFPWHLKRSHAIVLEKFDTRSIYMYIVRRNQSKFLNHKALAKKEKQRTSTAWSGLAFSEKRLTRTKEQKRSMNACSMSEFWWGCKILHQSIRNIIHKLRIMLPSISKKRKKHAQI